MTDQLTITGSRGAPSNISAVVFDFDDTIADTFAARVHAMEQTFAWAGIEQPTAEQFLKQQRGIPLQVALDGFEAARDLKVGMLNVYRAAYWVKKAGLLKLFDGVQALLSALQQARVPTGIVTSKSRDIVVEGRSAGTLVELEELGLSWLAPHTIGFEDVTHPKPHPEGVERVLSGLGASPAQTLVVGDSPADIQAAHNAGCWSCLAGWGVSAAERDLDAAMPDVVAEHPSALHRLLLGGT